MTDEERAHIEKRLQDERARAVTAMRKIEADESEPQRDASGELSRVPSHMADEASQTQEQEKDFLLLSRGSRLLNLIDNALELLHESPGDFERCEECGRPIEFERFDLIPWTRLCAISAKKQEGPADRPRTPSRTRQAG